MSQPHFRIAEPCAPLIALPIVTRLKALLLDIIAAPVLAQLYR
jgi:hypothetical protein